MRFDRDMVDQATKLNAAFPSANGWMVLVVGQEVADRLVADHIARALKEERRRECERKRWDAERGAGTSSEADGGPTADGGGDPEDEARRERERRKQAKERAERFNAELGVAVVKALAKVKVDEVAVKILSAVDVNGELDKIAKRGARYGFPAWAVEETTKTGKARRRYLEGTDAEEKAREFLAGAGTAAELVGRQVALLVMARMADEDAVANSARSFYELSVRTSHSALQRLRPTGRAAMGRRDPAAARQHIPGFGTRRGPLPCSQGEPARGIALIAG